MYLCNLIILDYNMIIIINYCVLYTTYIIFIIFLISLFCKFLCCSLLLIYMFLIPCTGFEILYSCYLRFCCNICFFPCYNTIITLFFLFVAFLICFLQKNVNKLDFFPYFKGLLITFAM